MENHEKELVVQSNQYIKEKREWSIGRKILAGLGAVCLLILLIVVTNFLIETIKREHNKEKYKDAEYVKQDTLNYLEKRYGEEFEIESVRGMSYAYDYINMYAYPKGLQDEAHKFKIQGRFNKEGNLEYCDSYVMVKLTDDYEAYIDPIIREYFKEYKFYVRFDSEWITSNLPPDTKLEDLWKLRANVDYPLPTLHIIFSPNMEEKYRGDALEFTMELLQKQKFRGCVETIILFDETLYSNITCNNEHEVLDGKRTLYDGNVIFIYDDKIK